MLHQRRFRTAREKAAILAEVDAERGKVRLVARRHNIAESLIYTWRSARKVAAVAMGAAEPVAFIPAGIIEGPVSHVISGSAPAAPERASEPAAPSSSGTETGALEITLPNGARLNVDASVNEKVLSVRSRRWIGRACRIAPQNRTARRGIFSWGEATVEKPSA
jgi:transposase